MNKVALIIIYNHQYNKNIDILEGIYQDRFTHIYHLIPFYNGDKRNVIPVYENSRYFQGYIAQAFKFFYKEEYKHYFFIGDDLLLNPAIDQTNYTEHFHLKDETCFIPELVNLHESGLTPTLVDSGLVKPWPRVAEAFYYNPNLNGVEAKQHLPDYKTALKAFEKFNLTLKPLKFHQIWQTPHNLKAYINTGLKESLRVVKNKLLKQTHNLPYPIVGGYSDICIVSADAIKAFAHYCGITAATNLFVEVGLPTSLVFSAKEIITEKTLSKKGRPLWTTDDYRILEKYNNQLPALLNNFPDDLLYIHPIKLSKWVIDSPAQQ